MRRIRSLRPVLTDSSTWVFAYGSLLWRPGFEFRRSTPATLTGWKRRFWQGSPDHRGTKINPGRVVTLLRQPSARCAGIAYELPEHDVDAIMRSLDLREQGGYVRESLHLTLGNGNVVPATTWIAHPENENFLGPASSSHIAQHLVRAVGPSGTNLDYFRRLARALEGLSVRENHLRRIARWLPA